MLLQAVTMAPFLGNRLAQREAPNPSGDFEYRGYYLGPDVVGLGGSGLAVVPPSRIDDNHSLVAETGADNNQVLSDLWEELYGHDH